LRQFFSSSCGFEAFEKGNLAQALELFGSRVGCVSDIRDFISLLKVFTGRFNSPTFEQLICDGNGSVAGSFLLAVSTSHQLSSPPAEFGSSEFSRAVRRVEGVTNRFGAP